MNFCACHSHFLSILLCIIVLFLARSNQPSSYPQVLLFKNSINAININNRICCDGRFSSVNAYTVSSFKLEKSKMAFVRYKSDFNKRSYRSAEVEIEFESTRAPFSAGRTFLLSNRDFLLFMIFYMTIDFCIFHLSSF